MDGDDAQDGDDCGDNEDDEKRMISSLVKMATLAMMRLMQLIGVTPISIDIGKPFTTLQDGWTETLLRNGVT